MSEDVGARSIRPVLEFRAPADAQAFVELAYENDRVLLFNLMSNSATAGSRKAIVDRLLKSYGSFARVISAPIGELCRFGGLTNSDILALKSVNFAAIQLIRSELDGRPVIGNCNRLNEYLIAALSRQAIEQFRVLYLDAKNHLIADELQVAGTVNSVSIYPRETLKRALELNATSLILVHNHPSGDPTPSAVDFELTETLSEIVGYLSIQLHDHIIVGNGRTVSFRALGLIPPARQQR